jgi:hypothetical protein
LGGGVEVIDGLVPIGIITIRTRVSGNKFTLRKKLEFKLYPSLLDTEIANYLEHPFKSPTVVPMAARA